MSKFPLAKKRALVTVLRLSCSLRISSWILQLWSRMQKEQHIRFKPLTRPSVWWSQIRAFSTHKCWWFFYSSCDERLKLFCCSIFLYLVLLAVFGGTCYFIYNTWITTLFPQKRRGGKGGERAKRSSGGSKKVDPTDQVSVLGADGPAVTSGAKAYDESWIPAHHINRPEAKRVKSSGPRPKSRAKPEWNEHG